MGLLYIWILARHLVHLETEKLWYFLSCQLGLLNTLNASMQRGKTSPTNECPAYDTKLSDGEVPVILELWGMRSTPSLPLLPGSPWPGVVAPGRVLSMSQIELNCVLMLNWTDWNSTVLICKLEIELSWPIKLCKTESFEMELFLTFKLHTLNWILWNRTVWLDWIALNRNVFDNYTVFMLI